MVRRPVLNAGCSPLGGLGVVGREGMGVVEREPEPFSLPSFPSVAMCESRSDCGAGVRTLGRPEFPGHFDVTDLRDVMKGRGIEDGEAQAQVEGIVEIS